ncbi:hypothetical protein F8178_00720 [Haloechinothrix sp. LS1_15]|nr:hypothetical protein [Haloechinothrix sp. LS1_15]
MTPKKGGGAFVAGAVLATAVAAHSGALGGSAAVSSSVSVGTQAAASAKVAARSGNRSAAWRHLGIRVAREVARHNTDCAAHAYGQVRQYFAGSPCQSLDRVLLTLADDAGNSMVLSVSWVRMPDAGEAIRLKELVDTYGTGNVAPIGMAALEEQGITFTGQHYDSRRDGSLVVIAESEPASGRPSTDALDTAAEVGAQFPGR